MAETGTVGHIVQGASMLAIISAGVFATILVFCWPLLFFRETRVLLRVLFFVAHASLMVFCDSYLCVHRKAMFPIRFLLMPIVMKIQKSDAIAAGEATWYVPTKELPPTNDPKELLEALPKRVRREVKRKLRAYERRGISTSTEHSDHLSLHRDMPVLLDHERRAVRGTDKSFVGEFIKRFLVVFVCTSGYIDRYYVNDDNDDFHKKEEGNHNNKKPVALSLFVGQARVLHTLMYFCKEEERESGIWFYQHFRMILRAAAAAQKTSATKISTADDEGSGGDTDSPLLPPSIVHSDDKKSEYDYLNFQVHQDFAKKCVGARAAESTDKELLDCLYPFDFFHEPSALVTQTPLNVEGIKLKSDDKKTK